MTKEQSPPSSIEAELAVLSSLIKLCLAGESWPQEVDSLAVEDFYRDDTRLLFETMQTMYADDLPIDLVTLKNQLVHDGIFDKIGGIGFLMDVVDAAPSTCNLKYYLNIVIECSRKRDAILLAEKLQSKGYSRAASSADICELLETEGGKLKPTESPESYLLKNSFAELDQHNADRQAGRIKNIPLPWATLHNAFDNRRGLPPKTIGLLSAATGIGKTWFGLQLGIHASEQGISTFYLNTEMTPASVAERLQRFGHREYLLRLPFEITPPEMRTLRESQLLFKHKVQDFKLLILDHIGDLNYSRPPWEVLPYFTQDLRDISRKSGSVIILITHQKSGDDNQLSYSKQMENCVDWHIALGAPGEGCTAKIATGCGTLDGQKLNRVVSIRKNRFGLSFLRVAMDFNSQTLKHADLGRIVKLNRPK